MQAAYYPNEMFSGAGTGFDIIGSRKRDPGCANEIGLSVPYAPVRWWMMVTSTMPTGRGLDCPWHLLVSQGMGELPPLVLSLSHPLSLSNK